MVYCPAYRGEQASTRFRLARSAIMRPLCASAVINRIFSISVHLTTDGIKHNGRMSSLVLFPNEERTRTRADIFWRTIDAIGWVDFSADQASHIRLRLLVIFSLIVSATGVPLVTFGVVTEAVTGIALFSAIATILSYCCVLPVLWLTRSITKAGWFALLPGVCRQSNRPHSQR